MAQPAPMEPMEQPDPTDLPVLTERMEQLVPTERTVQRDPPVQPEQPDPPEQLVPTGSGWCNRC